MPPRSRYPDCAYIGAVLSRVRLCCVLGRGASSLRFYPWITAALLSRRNTQFNIPLQPSCDGLVNEQTSTSRYELRSIPLEGS